MILKRRMTCVTHKVLPINGPPDCHVLTGCPCIACHGTLPYSEEVSPEHELDVYVIKLQLFIKHDNY